MFNVSDLLLVGETFNAYDTVGKQVSPLLQGKGKITRQRLKGKVEMWHDAYGGFRSVTEYVQSMV